FQIRRADLQADRNTLIDLMFCHLTPMSDGARYDWLYRENPDGEAQIWVLTDSQTDSIIGSGGSVPRRMYVNGEERFGPVLEVFGIHPAYRTLGPALQLQRACLAGLAASSYNLFYDFPKTSMVAIYRRIGVKIQHQTVRHAKLLRVETKLQKLHRIPIVGAAFTSVANILLELQDRTKPRQSGCTISAQEDFCGPEFTELARQASTSHSVCVARTANYLNWRFLSHFHHRFHMLTARQNGQLLGYVFFLEDGESGTIVDLFAIDDPGVKLDLISAAVAAMRKNPRLASVSLSFLSSHPQRALFLKRGFFARESHPVIVAG